MGYDVHITRKRDWSDDDGPVISVDEWVALLAGDPKLDELVWHDDDNGNLVAKNPDRNAMLAILLLAQKLDARVQGDDGEIYTLENFDALGRGQRERGLRPWLLFLRPYLLFGAIWFVFVVVVLWLMR